MLHDVIYNTSGKVLERNSSYDYVYLVDPQKVGIAFRGQITYGSKNFCNKEIWKNKTGVYPIALH